MRSAIKKLVNSVLHPIGARAVNRDWGPRGFHATFERARTAGLHPKTVIDVGASDGRWSSECMRVFPDANYCLFDALPDHASDLKQFAARHRNVKFWSGALGRESGTADLNTHGHQSSFLKSSEFSGRANKVEVRSLDSFISDMSIQAPAILKADVQGFELEVLAGATKCLERVELALLEVSFRRLYDNAPLADEVVCRMRNAGFRIYDISNYAQRPLDGALAQADLAFARYDSALFGKDGWA
jgi:FkbM family methyltransferase